MNDTTATVRKEILEDAKAEIDEQIDGARNLRDHYPYMNGQWRFWDAEIDRLLLEKDNLPDVLFHDEIEPTEAEEQALERRLAELGDTSDLGTHTIISGGEVLEVTG